MIPVSPANKKISVDCTALFYPTLKKVEAETQVIPPIAIIFSFDNPKETPNLYLPIVDPNWVLDFYY